MQVVGSVGFQLRKDDPEGLRGVILAIQQHSAEAATTAAPPQLELLSLMLRAVKNNNESKVRTYFSVVAKLSIYISASFNFDVLKIAEVQLVIFLCERIFIRLLL